MISMRAYIRQFAGFAFVYFAGIIILNVSVDPCHVFHGASPHPLDAYKRSSTRRVAKAEIARQRRLDVLLIGDSRTLCGINPLHPLLTQYGETYNLAFNGGTIYEGHRLVELATHRHPPRLIVWGFDPEMIPAYSVQQTNGEFACTRLNPDLDLQQYYRLHTIGLSTAGKSLDALLRPVLTSRRVCVRRGMNCNLKSARSGYSGTFVSVLAKYMHDSATLPMTDNGVARLRPCLERYQANGTRLILLFPPMHATRHEASLRREHLRRLAEACVRELVHCVDTMNSRHPERPPIEVWDFRGFTRYHAESLPRPGSHTVMKWYWEPLHFKEELGNLILAQIFEQHTAAAGWGARLTGDNVDEHLAGLERARAAWLRRHPEQTALVSAAERLVH
jgi:hypothetical protein